jgi:FAD:protein FMN transferase
MLGPRSPAACVRAVLCLLLVALAVTGCTAPTRHEFTQIHMGVACRITIDEQDAETAKSAARAAFARIALLDTALSDYRLDNELARVNAAAGGPPTPIGPDLHAALVLARELAAKTNGAFDPTIGPAVQLWRESRRAGTLPDEPQRTRAATLVSWQQLELSASGDHTFTARLARPGMRLDLGGIGKGIACDEAAIVLRAAGTSRFLISFGGDLLAGDAPRNQPRGWRIAQVGAGPPHSLKTGGTGVSPVQNGPAVPHRRDAFATDNSIDVNGSPSGPPEFLKNIALSTSGDSEQFVIIDGVRYSHIVDPRTALGRVSPTRARVMHKSSAVADALATALCVLGPGASDVQQRFRDAQSWIDHPEEDASTR